MRLQISSDELLNLIKKEFIVANETIGLSFIEKFTSKKKSSKLRIDYKHITTDTKSISTEVDLVNRLSKDSDCEGNIIIPFSFHLYLPEEYIDRRNLKVVPSNRI